MNSNPRTRNLPAAPTHKGKRIRRRTFWGGVAALGIAVTTGCAGLNGLTGQVPTGAITAAQSTVEQEVKERVGGLIESLQHQPEASQDDVVYSVDTDEPVVFLTIDDGATRDPDFVTALAESGVPATLFLTDSYVEADPEYFQRVRDEAGATIQNHTLDHPVMTKLTQQEQAEQICGTNDRLAAHYGQQPTLFRPPYGAYNDATLAAARECGMEHVVHWTAEVKDGEMNYAAGDELRAGNIVLAHFTPDFEADLAAFIAEAERAGLTPALLDDYLD